MPKIKRDAPQAAPRPGHLLAFALLAALVLAAYSNSFQGAFVQDNRRLLEDPRVRAVSIENIKQIFQHSYWWPTMEAGLYRPVTSLSYLFNYAVVGNEYRPEGYHALNVLLHAANACLVFRLAFLLLNGFWPAFFTAAIWALHPVATESVTNIIGRSDELAAMAVLGGLLLYIRSTAEEGRKRVPWLAAVMVVTTLGVFSKESAVVVIGAALLYDITWWGRPPGLRGSPWTRSTSPATGPTRASAADQGVCPTKRLAGYAAFVPPLVAMWLVRWRVFANSRPAEFPYLDNPLLGAGFLASRLTAIKVIGKYAGLLVWPGELACDRSFNQIPMAGWGDAGMAAPVAIIVGLLWLAAICYRRERVGFFWIAFAALALLPAANLVVLIGSIMAERFLYLPAVGLAASVVLGVYAASRRFGWKPATAPAVLCLIACALGARTLIRNNDWHDEESLWRAAVAVAPNSFKTHLALGASLNERGPAFIDQAIVETEKAAAIVEGVPTALNSTAVFFDLGSYYMHKGDLAPESERAEWYRKAVQMLGRGAEINREVTATVRRKQLKRGDKPDAIGVAGMPELFGTLGQAYLRWHNPEKAVEALSYARLLAPQDALICRTLAAAYSAAGKNDKIVPALLEALILDNSAESLTDVLGVYGKMDPGGCAAIAQGGQRFLNPNCPQVRRDFCAAYQDLAKVYREAKFIDLSDQAAAAGREQYGCSMGRVK